MANKQKKKKFKSTGFIITTAYHIIAAVVSILINSGALGFLNISVLASSLIMLISTLATVFLSFVITLTFKIRNKSRVLWVLLIFVITFMRIFGITLLTMFAPQFVEENIEMISSIYNSWISSVVFCSLLYLISLAALNNCIKKKPTDPYACLENITVDKKIHEYIYDEFGNFGD